MVCLHIAYIEGLLSRCISHADSVVFNVNGLRTFHYPRIETDLDGQFPFDRPFYLLLDMQLGGSWVGEVNPDDLPVEMYIDWFRFYEWK